MAISFAKHCKDRCPVFSPCFQVIPVNTWGKNGTCPVITQPIEISQGQKWDIGKPCRVHIIGIPTCGAPC